MKQDNAISTTELVAWVSDARERTMELVADLTDEQMMGPLLAIVNPLWWEIGHVAWFQERWVLRRSGREPSLRADADALYDSAEVPHDDRWSLPLPSRAATLDYLRQVRAQALARLSSEEPGEEDVYFHQLAVFHEDMHTEAFTYTRQTLGLRAPRLSLPGPAPAATRIAVGHEREQEGGGPLPGDVWVPGGR